MNRNLPKCGEGVGATDELVGRLVADLTVDRASRRKGGGDHFRLPVMRPLLARLGGAKTLVRLAASDNAGGFGVSEVMGADVRMMAAGLSMGQIQRVSREVMEAVNKTVVAIPGLLQFT